MDFEIKPKNNLMDPTLINPINSRDYDTAFVYPVTSHSDGPPPSLIKNLDLWETSVLFVIYGIFILAFFVIIIGTWASKIMHKIVTKTGFGILDRDHVPKRISLHQKKMMVNNKKRFYTMRFGNEPTSGSLQLKRNHQKKNKFTKIVN